MGLISKQVRSKPRIYDRIVQGNRELADSPIYREVRNRGGKVIRDMHKPPVGRDDCEGITEKGMLRQNTIEEEDESDREIDIERQEGKRDVEKFVHGIRNGEIVGEAANERRMKHATIPGNKPSFWTYLKENGCRGCQENGGNGNDTTSIGRGMSGVREKQEM
eukprot:6173836-Pleurochrysis_carterae.AAC.1